MVFLRSRNASDEHREQIKGNGLTYVHYSLSVIVPNDKLAQALDFYMPSVRIFRLCTRKCVSLDSSQAIQSTKSCMSICRYCLEKKISSNILM